MKFTDMNGIEIECSPAEYLELQGSQSQSQSQPLKKIFKPKKKIKSGRTVDWKERMIIVKQYLESNSDKSFSISGISNHFKFGCGDASMILKRKLINDNDVKKIIKRSRIKFASKEFRKIKKLDYNSKVSKPKIEDMRVKRLNFINSRCKNLQIQDIHMSRDKALSIASSEWKNKGKIVKVKVETEDDTFPPLYGVTAKSEPTVIARISECISHGRNIGYFDLKEVCEWKSGVTLVYFINSFMNNKTKIAKFFSVPDKFRTEKINNYDYIIYGYKE